MSDNDARITKTAGPGRVGSGHARRTAPLALLVAVVALGTLALLALGAGATITGDQPPASGDWVVRNPTAVDGETIDLGGDLVVEAVLTVNGSTLLLAPASDGALEVNVTPAGNLTLSRSRVASSTGAGYAFVIRGPLDASNTTIEDCAGGVRVATAARVRIADCAILDPSGAALVLEGANDTTVERVRIAADGFTEHFSRQAEARGTALVEVAPLVAPGLVRIVGGSPVIRGLDLSVNRTVEVALRLDAYVAVATFSLDVEALVVEASAGSTVDVTDLVVRDSLLTVAMDYDHHVHVPGVDVDTTVTVTPHVTLMRASNCPDVRLQDTGLRDVVRRLTVASFRSDQPEPVLFKEVEGFLDPLVLDHLVDATYTGEGPHAIRVRLDGLVVQRWRVLRSDVRPGASGVDRPEIVTDVVVANVTAWRCTMPVQFRFHPAGSMTKNLDTTFRVSDCVFDACFGGIVLVQSNPGPYHDFDDLLVIERCTFSNSSAGEDAPALIATGLPGAPRNHEGRSVELRGCAFTANTGPLVDLVCSWELTWGPQTAVVDNCTIRDNRGLLGGYLISIENWDVTVVSNSTFVNNTFDRAVRLYDLGGRNDPRRPYVKPSDFSIRDCTFERNVGDAGPGKQPEVVEVTWSGSLKLSGNHLGRSRVLFLNCSEYINVNKWATLSFQGNDVSNRSTSVVFLTIVDSNHTKLTVTLSDNLIRDCTAPLIDYPHGAWEVRDYSWDARIDILNNTARRCTGAVFWCYGDLRVADNVFEDCIDYPLVLDNLLEHQPVLERNSFVGCTDCVWVGAKRYTPVRVLMFVYDTEVNCSGTAFWFFRMEANLTRCNVTGASASIVAEDSVVDALDCRLEVGSGRVEWIGTIRVWFDVEARVEWADAYGVASGNPVGGAAVSAYDRNGTFATSHETGADGRTTEGLRVLQWYMDLFATVLEFEHLSPYNLTATCTSLAGSATVEVDRSYRGDGAVLLLIVDPHVPTVVILEPVDGAVLNVTGLLVVGYCEDRGSGTFILELDWGVGDLLRLALAGATDFRVTLPDFPEGELVLRARVYDHGMNMAEGSVRLTVDRTPPRLVVLEPADGFRTNRTTVTLRAEVEPGTRVWVDLREMDPATGVIEMELGLNEGPNTVVLRSVDGARNEARVELHLWLDTVPPELEVVEPRDGLVTNRSLLLVLGYVSGQDGLSVTVLQGVQVVSESMVEPGDGGEFRLTVALPEGGSRVEVRAWDDARNNVLVVRYVNLDTTPPVVAILSPVDGHLTNQVLLVVVIEVPEDAEQAFLAGRMVLRRGTLEQEVLLAEGANAVVLRAVDRLGNERQVAIRVTLDTVAPALAITAPAADPLLTNLSVVTVSGTAAGADSVTVGGVTAVLLDSGTFTAVVALPRDGTHAVEVVARDLAGNNASVTVTVVLDTVAAPLVLAFEPPDAVIRGGGGVLRLKGTTDATGVRVEVVLLADGTEVSRTIELAGDMTFEHELRLSRGPNRIVVRLLDAYGNLNVSAPYEVTYTPDDGGPSGPITGTGPLAIIILAVALAVAVAVLAMVRHGRRQRRQRHARGGSSRE